MKFGNWIETYGIDYKHYFPINLTKGNYIYKIIIANFILSRIKGFVKWFS